MAWRKIKTTICEQVYYITDGFEFANETRSIPMKEEDILVSYDVRSFFEWLVRLSEADKAFLAHSW